MRVKVVCTSLDLQHPFALGDRRIGTAATHAGNEPPGWEVGAAATHTGNESITTGKHYSCYS